MYPTFDGSENKPYDYQEKFDLHPEYESQIKGTPEIQKKGEAEANLPQ